MTYSKLAASAPKLLQNQGGQDFCSHTSLLRCAGLTPHQRNSLGVLVVLSNRLKPLTSVPRSLLSLCNRPILQSPLLHRLLQQPQHIQQVSLYVIHSLDLLVDFGSLCRRDEPRDRQAPGESLTF